MVELADGGFPDETGGTGVLYVMNHVDLCPSHNRYQTLAMTASATGDGGEVVAALQRR